MRQSLGLIALILFVAGLSFVLSAQDQQGARPINTTLTGAAAAPGPAGGDANDSAKPLAEAMRAPNAPSAEKNNGRNPQRRIPQRRRAK